MEVVLEGQMKGVGEEEVRLALGAQSVRSV